MARTQVRTTTFGTAAAPVGGLNFLNSPNVQIRNKDTLARVTDSGAVSGGRRVTYQPVAVDGATPVINYNVIEIDLHWTVTGGYVGDDAGGIIELGYNNHNAAGGTNTFRVIGSTSATWDVTIDPPREAYAFTAPSAGNGTQLAIPTAKEGSTGRRCYFRAPLTTWLTFAGRAGLPAMERAVINVWGNLADPAGNPVVQETVNPAGIWGTVTAYIEDDASMVPTGIVNLLPPPPVEKTIGVLPIEYPIGTLMIPPPPEPPPPEFIIGTLPLNLNPRIPAEREFQIGYLSLASRGSLQPPPIPAQEPRSIPIPTGVVPLDDRDLFPPVKGKGISVFQFINNSWRDITAFVAGMVCRHGFDHPTRTGVARPMDGSILLNDPEGWFSPFNPNPAVSPYPGTPMRIVIGDSVNNTPLFNGYCGGVTMREDNTGTAYHPVMLLHGLFKRLQDYGEGFTDRLVGEATISQTFAQLLDTLGWPREHRSLSDRSRIQIYDSKVNQSTLLAQGKTRVKPLPVFQELAMVEGGKVYDRPDGYFVYETRLDRQLPAPRAHHINNPNEVRTLPMDAYVINRAGARFDVYERTGVVEIYFTNQPEYPITVEVPANSVRTELLDGIDWARMALLPGGIGKLPDDSYIANWSPPIVTFAGSWFHSPRDNEIAFTFTNNTNQPLTATIGQLYGQPLRRASSIEYQARDPNSIRIYGPKNLIYPELLLVQEGYGAQEIQAWVDDWAGVDEAGNPAPSIGLEITLRDISTAYQISDLVWLSWRNTFDKFHCNTFPMWVDGVTYEWDTERHSLTAKLLLVSQGRPVVRDGIDVGRVPGDEVPFIPGVEQPTTPVIPRAPVVLNPREFIIGTLNLEPGNREFIIGTLPLEQREFIIGTLPLGGREFIIGTLTLPTGEPGG